MKLVHRCMVSWMARLWGFTRTTSHSSRNWMVIHIIGPFSETSAGGLLRQESEFFILVDIIILLISFRNTLLMDGIGPDINVEPIARVYIHFSEPLPVEMESTAASGIEWESEAAGVAGPSGWR